MTETSLIGVYAVVIIGMAMITWYASDSEGWLALVIGVPAAWLLALLVSTVNQPTIVSFEKGFQLRHRVEATTEQLTAHALAVSAHYWWLVGVLVLSGLAFQFWTRWFIVPAVCNGYVLWFGPWHGDIPKLKYAIDSHALILEFNWSLVKVCLIVALIVGVRRSFGGAMFRAGA